MKKFILSLILLSGFTIFAQRGKDKAKTVSAANTVVNEYTAVTANIAQGATSITVANNTLNANSRFLTSLGNGDLIMIIQMQGAQYKTIIHDGRDSTFGEITGYNNAGAYEIVQVKSTSGTNIINLMCGTSNLYNIAGKVQVVRIPRFLSLTLNSPGSITCDTWNGTTGGVVNIEVDGNTTIASGASIDASAKGFRGGGRNYAADQYNMNVVASTTKNNGGVKGESIAGDTVWYNNAANIFYDAGITWQYYGGMYGRGAIANAGGGGNANDGGGGGGANGGAALTWNGHGVPDLSGTNFTQAWNLEFPNNATLTSNGGGRGGYTFSNANKDALTVAPGNTLWGNSSDYRRRHGGYGGRPLDYSNDILFMGGGGGSGAQNPTNACQTLMSVSQDGHGGAGGGIVFLNCYGIISGAGQIKSNGENGTDATGTMPGAFSSCGKTGDNGAGGAGGGGAIMVKSPNNLNLTAAAAIVANGGNGGNQIMQSKSATENEAQGPGGGGGGGFVWSSAGTAVINVLGGNNGTTTATALAEFKPNGATKGNTGLSRTNLSTYEIATTDLTICSAQSVTLNASITGTAPASQTNANLVWYSDYGITQVGTGASYTFTATHTDSVYVGLCPGGFFKKVKVTVSSKPAITLTPASGTTYCNTANAVSLTATPSYAGATWSGTGVSGSTFVPSSVSNGTYYAVYNYTLAGGCSTKDSVQLVVNSGTPITFSAHPNSFCSTNTTYTFTLASGVPTNGTWSSNAPNGVFNPGTAIVGTPTTISYSLSGTCASSNSFQVTVYAPATLTSNPLSQSLCTNGSSVTITPNPIGGAWSTVSAGLTSTANSASFNPTTAGVGTHTLQYDLNGCSTTITYTVNTVNASITTAPAVFCSVDPSITLNSQNAGGSWTINGTASTNVFVPANHIGVNTVSYTLTNSGCTDTKSITLTVNANPNANITASNNLLALCVASSTSTITPTTTGGTWTTDASAGFTSNASSASFNPSLAGVGSYYVAYTVSQNSCTSRDTLRYTVSNSYNATITSSVGPYCANANAFQLTAQDAGGNWTINGTPSTTGIFDPSTANLSPATNSISYTIPGACGDTKTQTITVLAVPNASFVASNTNTSICSNAGVINLTPNTANGTWAAVPGLTTNANGSAIFNPSLALTNSVLTYSLSNGTCASTSSITYSITPVTNATITSASNFCSNSSAIALQGSPNGGTWSGNGVSAGVFTPAANLIGSNTITYSFPSATCIQSANQTINVLAVPDATFISSNTATTLCSNANSITLTPNNTSIIGTWSVASGLTSGSGGVATFDPSTATPNSATTLSYTVNNGVCSSISTTTYSVTGTTSSSVLTTGTYCANATPIALVGSPVGGTWAGNGVSGSNFDPSNANAGANVVTYTFPVSQCITSSSQTLTVTALPNTSITTSNDSICFNGASIQLSAANTGGTWSGTGVSSNGLFNPTGLNAGNYTITYSSTCSTSSNQVMTILPKPNATASVNQTSICASQCVNVTLTPTYPSNTITVNFGEGTASSSLQHCYANSGTYHPFVLISQNGCVSDTIKPTAIVVNTQPQAAFTIPSSVLVNTPVTVVNNSINAASYLWNLNDPSTSQSDLSILPTPSRTYTDTGLYCIKLTVNPLSTCNSSVTHCINVVEPLEPVATNEPNVFTPNGDGINDNFVFTLTGINTFKCEIFDRWGLVINSFENNGSWNGKTASGKDCSEGTYYYVLECVTNVNESKIIKGFIQLSR